MISGLRIIDSIFPSCWINPLSFKSVVYLLRFESYQDGTSVIIKEFILFISTGNSNSFKIVVLQMFGNFGYFSLNTIWIVEYILELPWLRKWNTVHVWTALCALLALRTDPLSSHGCSAFRCALIFSSTNWKRKKAKNITKTNKYIISEIFPLNASK